jgi:hypothetical protein
MLVADELGPVIDRMVDWHEELCHLTSDRRLIRAFDNANADVQATLAWTVAVFEFDAPREKGDEGKISPAPCPDRRSTSTGLSDKLMR